MSSQSARAVVCRELNTPVQVETITVDRPKRGEAMVKLERFGQILDL